MSATTWIIWTTIICIFVGWFVVWFVEKLMYKHKVRVIDLGKQNIELDFKARDYNKEGVFYWQLNKERNKEIKNIPIPPMGAINIAKRGKKSVTCFRTPTGEYIFLNRLDANLSKAPDLNKGIPKHITEMTDEGKKQIMIKKYQMLMLKKWRLENKGIIISDCYEPFTSKQRMVIVNNYEKAKTRKGFSLREQIPTIVSLGAAVILIVSLMIFWGDIAKPALDSKAMTQTIVDTQKESIEILREIELNVQKIEPKGGDGGG